MNRIDVNKASREELIKIIKQLRLQFSTAQASTKRISELEEQVAAQQREITAHNETIRAMTHQTTKLSEKSASDEETIGALIQQLEARWDQPVPPIGAGGGGEVEGTVLSARTVKTSLPFATPKQCASTATDAVPAALVKGITVTAGTAPDIADRPAATAAVTDLVAHLEAKVRELSDINAFHAALLSQRDESPRGQTAAAAESAESAATRRCRAAEEERDALRHTARQLTQANAALVAEQQRLCEELTRMELDLVAAEQWRADEAERPALFRAEMAQTDAIAFSSSPPPPVRTLAQPVTPIQYRSSDSHITKITAKERPRNWSVMGSRGDSTPPPPSLEIPRAESPTRASLWRNLLDIGVLQEMRSGNPSRQEKLLSERLELFQRYVEDMQAQELDRQRNFDEIERTRAELFTSMNEKLETQRREIQQLKRSLAETHAEAPLRVETSAGMPIAGDKADAACSPIVSLSFPAFESNAGPAVLHEEPCGIRETAEDIPVAAHAKERIKTVEDDKKQEETGYADEVSQQGNESEAELLAPLELSLDFPQAPHDCAFEQIEREEECARLRVISEAAETFASGVGRSALVMSHAAANVIVDAANRANKEAAKETERKARVTQNFTAALARYERWEPLRYLSEAYGDIVDAQRALLHAAVRPITTDKSVSGASTEEKQWVLSTLDAVLSRNDSIARRSENEDKRNSDSPPSCAGSEASGGATRGKVKETAEAEGFREEEEEEKEEKTTQETRNEQDPADITSWWDTSSAPLQVATMAPAANSVQPNTNHSLTNSEKREETTIATSDAMAMEPRHEVKEPFVLSRPVETSSRGASDVTADLGMLDFFSSTGFSTTNGKSNDGAQSFVAEFDPFA